LFVKLRPPSSFARVSRWSLPAADPATSANRSASAPISSIVSRGSTTLPFVLLIFWPYGSRTMPLRNTVWKGSRSVQKRPSIIIRATQKNRMS
jgi:hypothetical protein